MDEQQSTFKVTDRRLFNADGSPRDVPPEERPAPEAPKAEAAPKVEQPAPTVAETATSPPTEDMPTEDMPDEDLDRELTEEEVSAARDPASFLNFLMSIASNAASALGMMEHPVTNQRDVDLELGKHWIDVLGMLQKKTQGNLSTQEKQMLENLLADLRMQYVSLSSAPKTRSFSGSDITGGK
jgi:Domain of unknown function (DUF1844)